LHDETSEPAGEDADNDGVEDAHRIEEEGVEGCTRPLTAPQ